LGRWSSSSGDDSELWAEREQEAKWSTFGRVAQAVAKTPSFLLVVRLKLRPGTSETFKKRWTALARHCEEHEPSTWAYELATLRGDEDTILIYERYRAEEDLGQVSQAFDECVPL